MTSPTPTGSSGLTTTQQAEQKLMNSLITGGVVPQSWLTKPVNGQTVGAYRLTVFHIPGSDVPGYAVLQSGSSQASKDSYEITFDNTGKVTGADNSSAPGATIGSQTQQSAAQSGGSLSSTLGSLEKVLSTLTSSGLWKRIGIGLGGVLLFIIGIVLLMRRDIPTPADIIRKV